MKTKILLILATLSLLVLAACVFKGCIQRPSFDAQAIAASETAMWQAYYTGDRIALSRELFTLHRRHFRLTYYEAAKSTRHFTQAAMIFLEPGVDYNQEVLPELVEAYAVVRDASGLEFDPQKVAVAELSWWVTRRDPKRSSPENVGREIAALYAAIYGKTNASIERAGYLRAEAAALRDRGQKNADWPRIQEMLEGSYQTLAKGVASS